MAVRQVKYPQKIPDKPLMAQYVFSERLHELCGSGVLIREA